MKSSLSLGLGLGLVVWMTVGCLQGGERAQQYNNGWGDSSGSGAGNPGETNPGETCIAGEVCSDKTPAGLYFEGSKLFDSFFISGPHPVAAGGTQAISVYWDNQAGYPFDLPFDASASGVMKVTGTVGSTVTVSSNAPGQGYLRLFEPGTDLLYDRFSLTAETLVDLGAGPIEAFPFFYMAPSKKPWALLASSETMLVASLQGATGRLVDESIVLGVSGDATVLEESSAWDTRFVTVGAGGSVTFSVDTTYGPKVQTLLPVVQGADSIALVDSELGDPKDLTILLGGFGYYCFRAFSNGNPIAGVKLELTPSSGVSAETDFWPGCIQVTGKKVGLAEVKVAGAGAETLLELEVVSGAAGGAKRAAMPRAQAEKTLSQGERAARE